MHHALDQDNKEAVQKLWFLCIMRLSTRKQFKSCSVYASSVCQQESSSKVVVSMYQAFDSKEAVYKLWFLCIMCLSLRKQFKSCGIYTSCVCQLGRSLKVAVSMHHAFVI